MTTSRSLVMIDYDLLVDKDPIEQTRLFQASTTLGFFYLQLHTQLDPTPIFTLAKEVFELSLETNMKYLMDGKNGVYFGYKALGAMYADRKGTPDSIEFWNISKDNMFLKEDEAEFPSPIMKAKTVIKEYMIKAHQIVLVILETLSSKLGLDAHVLPNIHRLMQPSGDQLRMTKCTMHPRRSQDELNVALGAHTDFGSLTILFNQLEGLQVLASDGTWSDIQPLTGHAIVNIGDSMANLSGDRLKSNIHRVITTSSSDQVVDRYSVVYFSRPENNILMKSLMNNDQKEQVDEHVLTAQEWVARRVKNYQTINYENESTYEMSRGTEGHREKDSFVKQNL